MLEYCVTVSPDPKKVIGKTEYGAMSPKKQYQHLCYRLASTCCLLKDIKNWRFYFEISGNGNIHAHGSIYLIKTEGNTHCMAVKEFQRLLCMHFARNVKKQYFMDIAVKIKLRDDNIVSEKYKTWDEYLMKDQHLTPRWMMPLTPSDVCKYFDENEVSVPVREINTLTLDSGIFD